MRLKAAVVALAVLAITAGCYDDPTNDGGPKVDVVKTPDKVTYATGFGAVGRDAFIWVARDKGFFRDTGMRSTSRRAPATSPTSPCSSRTRIGEIEAMKPYAEPLGRLDEKRIAAGLSELGITALTPASVADLNFCSGTPTAGCS
ncbi:hypothetical protein [Actinoplanes sp. NPDC026619]|uniref:hypothetical protein n=1 Tax=Actinoplanes sp. NPDC026619 TaxID=3155798 RepID=UPI0033EA1DA6